MKHFSRYLLIGIVLTFVSFVVYGLFIDADVRIVSEVRVQDVSKEQIDKYIKETEHIKNWSVILQDSTVETTITPTRINWKYPTSENSGMLDVSENTTDIIYTITDPNKNISEMSFHTQADGNAVEITSVYTFEISFVYKFFKKSLVANFQKSLDRNLISLKEYSIK